MAPRSQLDWIKASELITSATEEISSVELCRDPIVSVALITYNHRDYVVEAIESILAQRTNFPIELVIGDDCSTDGTAEVVLDVQKRYPDTVRVLLATNNLGKYTGNGRLNLIRILRACRGRYVALLEGDDYWTCPTKLQKQVDFMEANPDCALCFHDIVRVDERGEKLDMQALPDVMKRRLTHTEILMSKFPVPPTASTVLRRDAIGELPEWFLHVPYGDRAIAALATRTGDAGYADEVMSAYRIHSGGIISNYGRLGVIQGEIVARKITLANFATNRIACQYNCERIVDFYRHAIRIYAKNRDWMKAARAVLGLAWFGCRHRYATRKTASLLVRGFYRAVIRVGSSPTVHRKKQTQV